MKTIPNRAGWAFDHSYLRLPEIFFQEAEPEAVGGPRAVVVNRQLAADMALDADAVASEVDVLVGNAIPEGAKPIAQAYAGHQFGGFTMLGDGRAILMGEHRTSGGRLLDVQWKGTGRTPYSRRGDGRAALGPMLREYVISEAMEGLRIPTTRSLAVAATGETVYRDAALPGAVLTRVAASHIRVGTFEFASACRQPDAVRILADYTMARHDPELVGGAEPYRDFLTAVIARQAALVAQWLSVGFIHGVMNTDNMAVSGETIDYGPCAFLDVYDPETVFSSIDRHGRYAYGNQPTMAHWNLARFAETLIPLLADTEEAGAEVAREVLSTFPGLFRDEWHARLRAKLGLFSEESDDVGLIERFLEDLRVRKADFTNTFRALDPEGEPVGSVEWWAEWKARLGGQPQSPDDVRARLRQSNPAVIPRNHKVEEALAAAVGAGDLSPLHRLVGALQNPWVEPEDETFCQAAPAGSEAYQTFCGT